MRKNSALTFLATLGALLTLIGSLVAPAFAAVSVSIDKSAVIGGGTVAERFFIDISGLSTVSSAELRWGTSATPNHVPDNYLGEYLNQGLLQTCGSLGYIAFGTNQGYNVSNFTAQCQLSPTGVVWKSKDGLAKNIGGSFRFLLEAGALNIPQSSLTLNLYINNSYVGQVGLTPQPHTITFSPQSTGTYGTSFSTSATSNLGLPVTITSDTTSVCTISSSEPYTVTPVNVGTCTLRATQPGSGGTEAAQPVTRDITISRKTLTISNLNAVSRKYNGTTTATFSGSPVLNGIVAGDIVSVIGTPSGNFTSADAGSRTVTVSGLSLGGTKASLYSLTAPTLSATIMKADQTVTWNTQTNLRPSDTGLTLPTATVTTSVTGPGTATASPTGTISYLVVNAGTTGCTITGGKLYLTGEGQCTITAKADPTNNYNVDYDQHIVNVTRLDQTISWTPVTTYTPADSGTVFSLPQLTGDGTVPTDSSSITYTVTSAGTTACAVVNFKLQFTEEGSCTVRATASTTSDYRSVSQDITFTISRLTQNLTWNPTTNFRPGQSGIKIDAAQTSGDGAISYSIVDAGTTGCSVGAGGTLNMTDAGQCTVRATSATSPTYKAASKDIVFNVGRLNQSMAWTPVTEFTPADSGTVFSLPQLTGDGNVAPDSAITYTVTNAGSTGCAVVNYKLQFTEEGTCTVRATAETSPNYNAVFEDVTFTIKRLTQNLTWNPATILTPGKTGQTFQQALSDGDGAISYAVSNSGTTGCAVTGNTLTFTDEGNCTVVATAVKSAKFSATSTSQTFTISRLNQIITWSPQTEFLYSESGTELALPETTGDETVLMEVRDQESSVCSLNGAKIVFTGVGICTIDAKGPKTANFNSATVTKTILVSRVSQRVVWNPTNVTASSDVGSLTPNQTARSSGTGSIRYSVTDAGASGCAVDAFTGVLQFSNAGTCVVRATAQQTDTETPAFTEVTFQISSPPIRIAAGPALPAQPQTTANITNLTQPLTAIDGSIPVMRGGNATMLINGVETSLEVTVPSSNRLVASTNDGIVFELSPNTTSGTNGSYVDSTGSIVFVPGTSWSLNASGFAPQSEIVVWLFSTPTKLATLTSDSSGSLLAEIAASLSLEPGNHTLQVSGMHPDGTSRALLLSVVVPEAREDNSAEIIQTTAEKVENSSGNEWFLVAGISLIVIALAFVLLRRNKKTS